MPKICWEEINSVIHKVKGTLVKCSKIELIARELRKEATEELNKLEEIILKQVNDKEV